MAMFITIVMLVDWMKKSTNTKVLQRLKSDLHQFFKNKNPQNCQRRVQHPTTFCYSWTKHEWFFLAKTSFQQKFWLRLFCWFFVPHHRSKVERANIGCKTSAATLQQSFDLTHGHKSTTCESDCDLTTTWMVFKSSNNPVFVTFYFGRNQIELFQELKLLNKKIARN